LIDYANNACLLNSLIYEFCFHFQFLVEHHLFMHGLEDDFAREKLAAEYICRELREADEANLLHEEGCLILFIVDLLNQPFFNTMHGYSLLTR